MNRSTFNGWGLASLIAAGMLAAGCETQPAEEPAVQTAPAAERMGPPHEGVEGALDPALLRRHADEIDSAATALQRHTEQMRALSLAEQQARLDQHVAQLREVEQLRDRMLREWADHVPADDEHLGAMLGMRAEEYRRFDEDLRDARADAARLRAASADELQARMSPHLDAVDDLARRMDAGAEHMRLMAGHHGQHGQHGQHHQGQHGQHHQGQPPN